MGFQCRIFAALREPMLIFLYYQPFCVNIVQGGKQLKTAKMALKAVELGFYQYFIQLMIDKSAFVMPVLQFLATLRRLCALGTVSLGGA